jgi:hypothetical protein
VNDPDAPLFLDHRRSLSNRVDDLIGRLTTQEKVGLLHQHQHQRRSPGSALVRS